MHFAELRTADWTRRRGAAQNSIIWCLFVVLQVWDTIPLTPRRGEDTKIQDWRVLWYEFPFGVKSLSVSLLVALYSRRVPETDRDLTPKGNLGQAAFSAWCRHWSPW